MNKKDLARDEFEQLLNDDEDFFLQYGNQLYTDENGKPIYNEADFKEWYQDVYLNAKQWNR